MSALEPVWAKQRRARIEAATQQIFDNISGRSGLDMSTLDEAVQDASVTGRKLHPYQERMLKLLESQTFKSVFPRVSLRRALCATPYLGIHGAIWIDDRYFSDGRQRSSLRIEWVDSSIGTRS